MSKFFRGDNSAHVSVFDVVHAMGNGQVDRLVIETMAEALGFCEPEAFEEMNDDELLNRTVCECDNEEQFSDRFKQACWKSDE